MSSAKRRPFCLGPNVLKSFLEENTAGSVCIFHIIAVDVLVTQGARASAAMLIIDQALPEYSGFRYRWVLTIFISPAQSWELINPLGVIFFFQ